MSPKLALRTHTVLAALLLGTTPALAADPLKLFGFETQDAQSDDARRRPGAQPDADRVEPAMDPNAVPPPQPLLPFCGLVIDPGLPAYSVPRQVVPGLRRCCR